MSATVGDVSPKTLENAKRQFVEVYGSALVLNTYLKIAVALLSLVALGLIGKLFMYRPGGGVGRRIRTVDATNDGQRGQARGFFGRCGAFFRWGRRLSVSCSQPGSLIDRKF